MIVTDPRISVIAALSDRYEIEVEIGRGGMATVYRARDKRHGSQVAIKVLRQDLVVALGGERFTREVRVTAALQHPHILPLLDSGEASGLPYYVMPFVSGSSLGHRLEREGPLPIPEAMQIVAEIADGLAYAHAKGLIHRDIKPENILLSEGHALIADFGIARVLDTASTEALTDSGLALGTAAYMSPEQAAGERVDARTDIYALGCVLFELLTGNAPFAATSQRALMARHAVDPVPSVSTVRPDVSMGLEAVIARALAKLPADRYATAAEFRTALLDAPALTRAHEALVARGVRRYKWAVGAGIVALAAMAGVLVWQRWPSSNALDANRVMVFPLLLPDKWAGSATAGEDVATMIGSVMDGAGKLRWIDGWQKLTRAQRDSMRLVSDSDAIVLARQQKCAWVLTGKLLTDSATNSVRVVLNLQNLLTDSVGVLKNAVSPINEPWRAGLNAVTQLLSTLIPGAGPEVGTRVLKEWSDRPPQAVALFLSGEADSRHLQRDEALTQFKAAVDVDSTFGYAAQRGAQAASWAHRYGDAKRLARIAVQLARTPRDRAFAAGLDAFLDGRADAAAKALRAALAIDPDMSAAWIQLSETYLHLLPEKGSPDSLANDALSHAIDLDSANTQLLFHRVELAARANDSTRTNAFAKRFLSVVRDSLLRDEVTLMAECVSGGWSEAALNAAAVRTPRALFSVNKMLSLSQLACMRAGYATLLRIDTANTPEADGRRFWEIVGMQYALLARGDTVAALTEIDRFIARWKLGSSIFLGSAPVVPAFAARARQVASADSARYGADYHKAPFSDRLGKLGVWAALDGRLETAQAVAADLAQRATQPGHALDSARAEMVLGHLAMARGNEVEAIRLFTAALRHQAPSDSVSYEDGASMGFERLTLGRLLVKRGRFAEARDVLEVLDSTAPTSFPLYVPAALQLRIKAALGLGDSELAAALRKRAERIAS